MIPAPPILYFDYTFTLQSVSAGRGWVCVVTSLWYIRLYSTSGIQLAVISLPGPVVCSAGNNLHLMVVYHRGSGKLRDPLSAFVTGLTLGKGPGSKKHGCKRCGKGC